MLAACEGLPYDLADVLPYDGLLNEPFQLFWKVRLQSPQRGQVPPPPDGVGSVFPEFAFKPLVDLDERLQRQARPRLPRDELLARRPPQSGGCTSHLRVQRRSGLSRFAPRPDLRAHLVLDQRRISVSQPLLPHMRGSQSTRFVRRVLITYVEPVGGRGGLCQCRVERRGGTCSRRRFRGGARALLLLLPMRGSRLRYRLVR
ncbi:hypothetical protein [Actinomadura sp. 21ATH]|uniref:hypothetical protein n=1 Tax=Actinomadura sp. 21ATH TaxID=1735444 RepID=UPI0035C0A46A